jgi:hypothetical protein
MRGHRGDQHDAPGPLTLHRRPGRGDQRVGAVQIDAQHALPVGFLGDGSAQRGDAGAGDHHVEAAVDGDRGAEATLERRAVADVEEEPVEATAGRADLGGRLVLRGEIDAEDRGAPGGQPPGDGTPDACRGAADQRHARVGAQFRIHGFASRGCGFRCA